MILLTSLFVRLVALVWSVVLLRRVNDWRMGFLSAMLALMGLRQALTLRKVVAANGWDRVLHGASTDELPGLVVSVLAGLAVVFLERMLLDQRRVHEELRLSESQALQAQKMEALGHLAGRTAHDFNNILAVILGNAELARMQLPEEHEALACLQEIETASRRAADLSAQILAFSRKQVVDETVFDFSELLLEFDPMLRRLLGSDVEYVTLPAAERALVRADRSQLGQVLVNLAVNARDAMPEGGTFTVDAALETSRGAETVVVRVADTGSGMTAEARQRAFEPFYTTKPVGKGTGLGLSTCLGIIERSRGTLTIERSSPSGTVVRLELPRIADSEPDRPQPVEAVIDGSGSELILVVDDETQLRRLEVGVLRNRGYQVLEAADGAEALQLVDSLDAPPDLLLTDVVMPQIGGPELARQLRQRIPDLPVLFTSGYVDSSTTDSLAIGGVSGFLQKPFGRAALASQVRALLDRHRASALGAARSDGDGRQ